MKAKKNKEEFSVEVKVISKMIYDRTIKWGKDCGLYERGIKKKMKRKRSGMSQKLSEHINTHDYGCYKESIAELIGIITGEKVDIEKEIPDKYISYEKGTVIIPLTDINSHGHPLGEAIFIIGLNIIDKHAQKSDFNLPLTMLAGTKTKYVRLPELIEVEDLIDNIMKVDKDFMFSLAD